MINPTPTKSDVLSDAVLDHHASGVSNLSIAAKVGCSPPTVRKILRSNGLKSNKRSPTSIEYVGDDKARCSDCGEIKSIKQFATLKNKDIPYRRSYCGACLARRNSLSLNADKAKFLKLRLQQINHRAKSKGLEFNIDLLWTLERLEAQSGRCFYTDIDLQISAGRGIGVGDRDMSLSFDRVDNSDGYLKSNVVLAASRINHMKSNATLDEMRVWMPEWHRRAAIYLGICADGEYSIH